LVVLQDDGRAAGVVETGLISQTIGWLERRERAGCAGVDEPGFGGRVCPGVKAQIKQRSGPEFLLPSSLHNLHLKFQVTTKPSLNKIQDCQFWCGAHRKCSGIILSRISVNKSTKL
jgi:hypothetical protein